MKRIGCFSWGWTGVVVRFAVFSALGLQGVIAGTPKLAVRPVIELECDDQSLSSEKLEREVLKILREKWKAAVLSSDSALHFRVTYRCFHVTASRVDWYVCGLSASVDQEQWVSPVGRGRFSYWSRNETAVIDDVERAELHLARKLEPWVENFNRVWMGMWKDRPAYVRCWSSFLTLDDAWPRKSAEAIVKRVREQMPKFARPDLPASQAVRNGFLFLRVAGPCLAYYEEGR